MSTSRAVLVDSDVFSLLYITPPKSGDQNSARVREWRKALTGHRIAISFQTRAEILSGATAHWGTPRITRVREILDQTPTIQSSPRVVEVFCTCTTSHSAQQVEEQSRESPPQQWISERGGAIKNSDDFSTFDAADYLKDLDDVTSFLEVALADSLEDPSAVPHALAVIARSQNMSELAKRVGISRDGLYKALSADGNPTWSTILKVTSALGLRFELHSDT